MGKNRVTVIFAFMIAIVMASSCGSSIQTSAPSGPGTTTASANFNASGYPIVNEKITISFFINNQTAAVATTYNDLLFIQEAERITNIHIDWIHPTTTTNEQLQLAIAAHEYPDIILANWNNVYGGVIPAADDNVIIPLEDSIEKYANNIWTYLKKYPELMPYMKAGNGHIYGFPMSAPETGAQLNYLGPMINKTWLDAVGKGIPTTLDEWEDVFASFRQAYPDKPTFCTLQPFIDDGAGGYVPMVFSAYGVRGFKLWQENKIVKYGPLTAEWKTALERIHTWYANEWLDNEFMSHDWSTFTALRDEGDHGAEYYWCRLNRNQNEWTGCPQPTLEKGGAVTQNEAGTSISVSMYSISSTNPYPNESVRYMDFFFGGEGMMLANWGIEGESYTMVNGVPEFTSLILDRENDEPLQLYTTLDHGFPFMVVQDASLNFRTPSERDTLAMWNVWKDSFKIPPNGNLSSDEQDELSRIKPDIDTYVREMITAFIIGTSSFNDFDTFLNKLKQLEVDKFMELNQQNADIFYAK